MFLILPGILQEVGREEIGHLESEAEPVLDPEKLP